MGLFKQFIEVIEWQEQRSDRMVYQFPVHKNEIKMGAQLTVRESQVALFINEGEIADVFEPGRYQLTTENMPILTKLKSWPYGFNSPFKAEVYFVNTKQFLDQKWGTTNPLMMRDAEFGIIRLRGFGTFAYRVTDPVQFMREVFGTKQFADTDIITPQLKQQILTAMADLLGESKIPALDLISNYEELGKLGAEKVQPQFAEYGLTLTNLTIQNLSLPPEVEAAMDKRTQMGVLGNLDTYTKFQVAESIRDAAQNEGGMAGIGASLGVGATMAQQIQQSMSHPAQTPAQSHTTPCAHCQGQVPQGAKFCPHCGQSTAPATKACVACQAELSLQAKFCPECGASQQAKTCRACQAPLKADAKFCSACGETV